MYKTCVVHSVWELDSKYCGAAKFTSHPMVVGLNADNTYLCGGDTANYGQRLVNSLGKPQSMIEVGAFNDIYTWGKVSKDIRDKSLFAQAKLLATMDKAGKTPAAVSAVVSTVEPACRCESFYQHDSNCAYLIWNQAQRLQARKRIMG